MRGFIENKQKIWDLAGIAFLILIVVIFFGKILFWGKHLFGHDFVFYFYPVKEFILDYVFTHGTIPFWNPYLFSGIPFVTNMQASIFYPLGFLYYLIPPELAYGLSMVLHCILGSSFMYLFMRTLSVSTWGALLGAVIFGFNGYFMGHLYAGHLSFVQNYIWIPLIFRFLHLFFQTINFKYVVLAGLVLGIQILGGFPQIAFYTILASVLYAFYFICINLRKSGLQEIRKITVGMGIVFIIGFSLAAIQLLPTYEFTQLSTRAGGVSYEFATLDSLPPKNFVTFLIPHFFGMPVNGTFWISDSAWEFWEFCGYVGICALILMLGSIKRLIADRVGIFFLFLLVIALFLALGKHNPLYVLIYHLPGFHSFRIPAQILFLYVFSVAVLAGKGLDYLKEMTVISGTFRIVIIGSLSFFMVLAVWAHVHPYSFFHLLFKFCKPTGLNGDMVVQIHPTVTHAILRSCAICLAIVIAIRLYEKRHVSYTAVSSLLLLICIADLWLFSFPMVQAKNLRPFKEKGHQINYLKRDAGVYRAVVNNRCLIENAGLWYGFQDIQGYDPLILKRYMEYINKSQQIPPDNKVVNMHYVRNLDNNLIDMLNLKYIIDCKSNTIIKRDGFVPRAYLVHKVIQKDEHEILDFMMSEHFNPSEMVILETQLNIPKIVSAGADAESQETCRILAYDNDEITVGVELNTPGFLIMSEINYPGWKAFVNGQKQTILTGNYLFRTVPLEAGTHTVRFLFSPVSFKLGTTVSLISFFVVIISLLAFRRKQVKKGIASNNDNRIQEN